MRCPNCGYTTDMPLAFCPGCGEKLGDACPSCLVWAERGYRHCGDCGRPLGQGAQVSPAESQPGVVPGQVSRETPYSPTPPATRYGVTPSPHGTHGQQPWQMMPAKNDGMCVASMVLGIISIVTSPLGIILGPLAIIFWRKGINNTKENPYLGGATLAKIGLFTGIAGIVFSILSIISLIILFTGGYSPYNAILFMLPL